MEWVCQKSPKSNTNNEKHVAYQVQRQSNQSHLLLLCLCLSVCVGLHLCLCLSQRDKKCEREWAEKKRTNNGERYGSMYSCCTSVMRRSVIVIVLANGFYKRLCVLAFCFIKETSPEINWFTYFLYVLYSSIDSPHGILIIQSIVGPCITKSKICVFLRVCLCEK